MSLGTNENTPAATALVWIESTRMGSAARTHLDGTKRRLRASDIPVTVEIADESEASGIVAKLMRLLRLVRAARKAEPLANALVARWHPFLAFVSPRWLKRGKGVLLLVQGNDETTYEMNAWFRKAPFSRWLMRRSLTCASDWLVLNEGLKEWLIRDIGIPPQSVTVLPTGVSDAFREARGESSQFGKYVIFFGSLAKWQGLGTLVEATRDDGWPADHRLLVIGDGEERRLIERNVSERVQYLGRLPVERTAQIVAAATCSICPKLDLPSMSNTTTPFKVLESVAAGVPVVATDIPAQVRMLDEGGYGLIARADDPGDLAEKINRICSDPLLRSELAARATSCGDELSWEAAAPLLAGAVRGAMRG